MFKLIIKNILFICRSQRGSLTLEAALVIPLFLLILFGLLWMILIGHDLYVGQSYSQLVMDQYLITGETKELIRPVTITLQTETKVNISQTMLHRKAEVNTYGSTEVVFLMNQINLNHKKRGTSLKPLTFVRAMDVAYDGALMYSGSRDKFNDLTRRLEEFLTSLTVK